MGIGGERVGECECWGGWEWGWMHITSNSPFSHYIPPSLTPPHPTSHPTTLTPLTPCTFTPTLTPPLTPPPSPAIDPSLLQASEKHLEAIARERKLFLKARSLLLAQRGTLIAKDEIAMCLSRVRLRQEGEWVEEGSLDALHKIRGWEVPVKTREMEGERGECVGVLGGVGGEGGVEGVSEGGGGWGGVGEGVRVRAGN